ncbi:MAG: methionyl-tRNA formyltransferase [Rhodospirillales bacterium]|nr:methionyl-tRNA formyltransferase [Rhodospirillales bacterium]
MIFLGSGEFGLPSIAALHKQHELIAVVTQPDRPAGRKRKLTPTPVGQWTVEQGIPTIKAEDANAPQIVEQIAALQADVGVIIAFGQKLSPQLIGALGRLAVNLHASLLPKYRGAAPINWAIMKGEKVTGVSVIGLAQRMDAGAIYAQASLEIDSRETAGQLHDRLAELGPGTIGQVLVDLEAGRLEPIEQDDTLATRAPKLTKANGTTEFNLLAEAVRCRIHGLTPWPGCRVNWHCVQTGETDLLILRRAAVLDSVPAFVREWITGHGLPAAGDVLPQNVVACFAKPPFSADDVKPDNLLRLLEVQGPGTKTMSSDAFSQGYHLGPGDKLSCYTPAQSGAN